MHKLQYLYHLRLAKEQSSQRFPEKSASKDAANTAQEQGGGGGGGGRRGAASGGKKSENKFRCYVFKSSEN